MDEGYITDDLEPPHKWLFDEDNGENAYHFKMQPLMFFYIALEHQYEEELFKALKEYAGAQGRFILAKERAPPPIHSETNGEHFHIAISLNQNQYEAFKKTIILKRFKRCGVARNGIGRQYGKIHETKVRDQTKFLSYTVKDNNYKSYNFKMEELTHIAELSYPKKDIKTQTQQCMDELLRVPPEIYPDYCKNFDIDISKIEKAIVGYYLDTKKRLSKSVMKLLTVEYLMLHLPNRENHKNEIYHYIKNS